MRGIAVLRSPTTAVFAEVKIIQFSLFGVKLESRSWKKVILLPHPLEVHF